MKFLLSALALVIFKSCSMDSDKNNGITLQDATDSTYKVGQVWHYKTRPSDPASTFTVVKIENSSVGAIFHISINDVKGESDSVSTISHAPFSKAALDSSKTELNRTTTTLPDFEEGYQVWREGFLVGKAGVFSLTVAQAVEAIDETWLNGEEVE